MKKPVGLAGFFCIFADMKKLVIFDLDGTLLDTIEDLGNAVNYILERHGMPQYTVEQYRKMVGHGIRNLIRKAFSPMELNDAYLETCVAEFKTYYLAHIDEHTRYVLSEYPELKEEEKQRLFDHIREHKEKIADSVGLK